MSRHDVQRIRTADYSPLGAFFVFDSWRNSRCGGAAVRGRGEEPRCDAATALQMICCIPADDRCRL